MRILSSLTMLACLWLLSAAAPAQAQVCSTVQPATTSDNRCASTAFVQNAIAAGLPFANPTATVGLSAKNGTATTAMRSDGAPALDQSISPTMTGIWTFGGSSKIGIGVSPQFYFDLEKNASANDGAIAYINRTANYTGGTSGVTGSALFIRDTVSAGVTNSEWALTVVLDSSSTSTDGGEATAAYFQGFKRSDGATWLSVFEYNDLSGADPITASVNTETDFKATGTDSGVVGGSRVINDIVLFKATSAVAHIGNGYRFNNYQGVTTDVVLEKAFVFDHTTVGTILQTTANTIISGNGTDYSLGTWASGAKSFKSANFSVDANTGGILGAAFNKVTITTPATGSTLNIADGKTLTDTSTVGAKVLLGSAGGGFSGYAGAICTNQFVRSLSIAGAATCNSVAVASDISGFGTGVATALGTNVGSAGSFIVNGGALGTPSSGTLTNATGLPISGGVSGLGSGIATFLSTPSSVNLAAALTDETGTGAAVFATGSTLVSTVLSGPSGKSVTISDNSGTSRFTMTTASNNVEIGTTGGGASLILDSAGQMVINSTLTITKTCSVMPTAMTITHGLITSVTGGACA